MAVTVHVVNADIATVDADALLIAIDARLRAPGGAAWTAYLRSIDREERADVAKFAEEDVRALTLRDGEAAAIPAHGRYENLIVAAALLHEIDGVAPSDGRMLEVLGRAAASAATCAAEANARTMAATVIGDRRAGLAHNHPVSSVAAVDAMARGFAKTAADLTIRWCILDGETAVHALRVCGGLGLSPRRAERA